MQTILTLTVGEFELVHDVLSLLIAATGAVALFFLLPSKQIAPRFHPLLLLAGIVAAISCYHTLRLFSSWNEAFELAGNSYAASGHFFHELYRYGEWLLTIPLLFMELLLAFEIPQEKRSLLLKHLIPAAFVVIVFTYLGASNLGSHEPVIRWSYGILAFLAFLYIARTLTRSLSATTLQEQTPATKCFFRARTLFLLSWGFYPCTAFLSLYFHGFGEEGLILFLVGASIADFLSKCGVSLFLYRGLFLESTAQHSAAKGP